MIKKIIIELQGKELELSLDEAQKLKLELDKIFKDKEYIPYIPYNPYNPWLKYPNIIWTSTGYDVLQGN